MGHEFTLGGLNMTQYPRNAKLLTAALVSVFCMLPLGCSSEVTTQPDKTEVYGWVLDRDQVGIGDAIVELFVDGKVKSTTKTKAVDDPDTSVNETGSYSIEAPAPADVRVQFSKAGHATKFYDVKTYTTAAGTIALRSIRQNASLVSQDATLTVKVIGADGNGVASARVRLGHDNYDLSAGAAPQATTPPTTTETPTETPAAATTETTPPPATAPKRSPDRVVTTGTDGSVQFSSLPADDGFKVTVAGVDTNSDGVADLEGGSANVDLSVNASARRNSVTIFANKALASTSLTVRVFAFGGPAFGEKGKARVTLTNSAQNLFIEKEVDEKGEVKFDSLPSTSGYAVNVGPFDADGDGFPDYKAKSVTGIALNTYSDTLQTVELEESSNAGFTVLYNSVGADGIIAPGDNIDLVFSQEIVKETADEPGVDVTLTDPGGNNVGFTITLDATGLKMTIDPAENLKENITGSYTLTLTSVKSVQGFSLAGGSAPTFKVRSGAVKLAAPAVALCTASVNCNTRSNEEVDYNTTAPDLQWGTVAGASAYRIYAKDSNRNTNWVRLGTVQSTGAATEVNLNTTLPTSFDSTPDTTTAPTQTPFADGTKVTFSVTAINTDNVEGDLDTTKVLEVADGRPPRIPGETFSLSAAQTAITGLDLTNVSVGSTANNGQNAAASGAATAAKTVEVRISGFPEFMSTGTGPAVSVVELAQAGCAGADNGETLTVPSWTWGPGRTEGFMRVTVAAGKNNAGDCILLKLEGLQDSSGNAEKAVTPANGPTPASATDCQAGDGAAAALTAVTCCNGDRCVVRLR